MGSYQDQERVRVLAFAGSLRRESYNRALLDAARELAPDGVEIEVVGLGHLPFYDADHDGARMPEAVRAFKEKIRAADAVLISTPEYNGTMSGVLHNALDWASRPHRESPLLDKPVAIASAAPGERGGARAQQALRHVLASIRAATLDEPELLVAHAKERFDDAGRLVDAETRDRLRELLTALADAARDARPVDERAA